MALVVLSGMVRGYTTIAGDFRALVHTSWGLALVAKLCMVVVALTLGAVNRLSLRQPEWPKSRRLRSARVLRAEAVAMLAVLILSATLANLPPPGD